MIPPWKWNDDYGTVIGEVKIPGVRTAWEEQLKDGVRRHDELAMRTVAHKEWLYCGCVWAAALRKVAAAFYGPGWRMVAHEEELLDMIRKGEAIETTCVVVPEEQRLLLPAKEGEGE